MSYKPTSQYRFRIDGVTHLPAYVPAVACGLTIFGHALACETDRHATRQPERLGSKEPITCLWCAAMRESP